MKCLFLRWVLSSRWFADRRGAATITYAVVLPLFLLLIFGSIQVWKIMAVRQSLRLGTYEAARTLSWDGRNMSWPAGAQQRAEAIVKSEVSRNSLAGSAMVAVLVEPPGVSDCDLAYAAGVSADDLVFRVTGTLGLPSPVKIPFLSPATMTLTVQHLGFLECPHPKSWRPAANSTPPPEGHAY